jgi:hypothetical protein
VVATSGFAGISEDGFIGFGMMRVVNTLRTFVAVTNFATSVRVDFKWAAFLKASENLYIAPLVV